MKKHVYVIDNDSSARIGLARLLRTAGYLVDTFDSTDMFLESLTSDLSGCVVVDIKTPGMMGNAFLEELKKRNLDLSIIVVTVDDCKETRRIAQMMGAIEFFRKPVDGTALLDVIKWEMSMKSKNGNDVNNTV